MNDFLSTIADGGTLGVNEAESAMHVLMRGESDPAHVAAFLVGLRARGETVDELVGFTRIMREYAVSVDAGDPDAVDLCGTGGDGSGTFNISTAASLVAAGAGVTVAKHGNRSVSSNCGSADVLEALGVQVELKKPGVEYCFEQAGIAFMYAPFFHPAMRHVMPVRRKLGVRTFFNILGPLCNPAGVRRQLVGAFDARTAQTMASILEQLDARHVMAVHSADGMDEVSLSDETIVFEFASGDNGETWLTFSGEDDEAADRDVTKKRRISPEDFGFGRFPQNELRGGDATENARILTSILEGNPGPARDVTVMNAACAIHTSGRYSGMEACRSAAEESIDSGRARDVLERLVEASNAAPAS